MGRRRLVLAALWLLMGGGALLAGLGGSALAATLTVDSGGDPNATLELRPYRLPDGSEAEMVVITGRQITLTIDAVVITGQRIEIDVSGGVVRVIGPGSFASGEERLEGDDLELRLDDERLSAITAVVFTSAIDVRGAVADRLPGQVTLLEGLASPCSRCGQETMDYAFSAARMMLFPGDRLVAWDVVILIRDTPVLSLPVLVIPLAQGDRQPQLLVVTGTATEQGEVRLTWPYVAGRHALGTFSVRYLVDVDPNRSAGLVGRLLGGAVERQYVGFELHHRYYDDRANAQLRLAYDPGRLPREGSTLLPALTERPPTWTADLSYTTEQDAPGTSVLATLRLDDRVARGRWLYQLALAEETEVLLARFDSMGYIDTDLGFDPRTPPAYASRSTPRRTAMRLRLDATDLSPVHLGALRVTVLHADLGLFEDAANPVNREAARLGIVSGGRLLLGHQVVLDRLPLWRGATLEGENRFEGRYYDTLERAVTWRSRMALQQSFGNVAQLGLSFDRDVEEGETPFRFDAAAARARTQLGVRFSFTPGRWLNLSSEGGYLFVEARRPETVGWLPLNTRLQLFGHLSWIDLSLSHHWPIADDDPGTLTGRLTLQARRSPADFRLTIDHLQDLLPDPGPPWFSESRTQVDWLAAVDRVASLQLGVTYRHQPLPEAGVVRHWDPLDARLTLGSMRSGDSRPGLRLQAMVELTEPSVERLTVELRANVGQLELNASQQMTLSGDPLPTATTPRPTAVIQDARLSVRWRDVLQLETRGLIWLPPSLLGHDLNERNRTLTVQLRELRPADDGRWEVSYRTTFDPNLGADGGRRDSVFEVRLALFHERLWAVNYNLEALADWALRDDRQPEPYLRRASLIFGADAFERVGLQGRLSYVATYDLASESVNRRELTIGELTVALRPTDELTVGARFRDVWDLTGSNADRSPWTFRPEVFFVWDRCCWALVGAWDSATGSIRIALTGPGSSTGLEQVFDTDLTLPRRPLGDDQP